jgi:hypothetical protein
MQWSLRSSEKEPHKYPSSKPLSSTIKPNLQIVVLSQLGPKESMVVDIFTHLSAALSNFFETMNFYLIAYVLVQWGNFSQF